MTTWEHLHLITYNVGDGPAQDKREDIGRLLTQRRPHALLLNEVADRAALLRWLASVTGYQLHQGDSRGRSKDAVMLRGDLPLEDSGHWPCSPRAFVGRWGAGPDTLDAKWIAWVETRFAGRKLYVGATHLVPSVQRGANTAAARKGRAKRRALFATHVAAIVGWFHTRRGIKIEGGDHNVTPDSILVRLLKAAGLRCSTVRSFKRRAIDQFWTRRRRAVRVVYVEGLSGYSSDHRPVAVTYAIRARRSK